MIKTTALGVINSTSPSGIYFGTVVSGSPLQIELEQKIILEGTDLILSTLVQDFDVDMTVNHYVQNNAWTDDPDDREVPFDKPHYHPYVGRKTFKVHLALQSGEKVIMIRCQGGKQFLVLDRMR